MKNRAAFMLFVTTVWFSTFTSFAAEFKLFYLGGQSNMNGFGYNKELPEALNQTFDRTYIFQGNPAADDLRVDGRGKWEKLRPGHGYKFSSNGKRNYPSERFGIELSFAKKMQELYPNDNIAIVKYARSGSSIHQDAANQFGSWEADYQGKNGINQYDHYLATIKHATAQADIDGDGQRDTLIPSGIIWMQGESDGANTEAIALAYYDNLKRLMDLMRASLRVDDLPVVIGKISDSWDNKEGKVWKYGELIQHAQEKFAREDSNADIVRSTRYYKYSDPWHYDSNGYVDLGEQFAKAYKKLDAK